MDAASSDADAKADEEDGKSADGSDDEDDELGTPTQRQLMETVMEHMDELREDLSDMDRLVRFNTKSLASAETVLVVTITSPNGDPVWQQSAKDGAMPCYCLLTDKLYHVDVRLVRNVDYEAIDSPICDQVTSLTGEFYGEKVSRMRRLLASRTQPFRTFLFNRKLTHGDVNEARADLRLPAGAGGVYLTGEIEVNVKLFDRDGGVYRKYDLPIRAFKKVSSSRKAKLATRRAQQFWGQLPGWQRKLVVGSVSMVMTLL
eukprot:PLAT9169.4.p1 GENE.PLAT9169.4~~PLAT9169.4.p1  ORF type:complete len:259 (+),score=67.94 PLAT9169.4:880-1656(+)